MADSQAQIYIGADVIRGQNVGTAYFACMYGRRPLWLDSTGPGSGPFALSGTWVACAGDGGGTNDVPETFDSVVRVDLRSGQMQHWAPASGTSAQYPDGGPATGLAIKADGSLAWISADFADATGPLESGAAFPREVHTVDATGEHTLASGLDIDLDSLALSSGFVYWTQAGQPASALLK